MALTQVQAGMVGQLSPSNLDTQAQYTGFKNRIINGAMMIDQRNAGASVTPANGAVTYTLDRWNFYVTQTSKLTTQQNAGSVTPPVGFTNYLGVTSSSAYSSTSSDQFVLRQPIEGFNLSDLGLGTANASTVTISFWVRSSLTGTFCVGFVNDAGDRSYIATYTINSSNTWEQKSITLQLDTTGTWLSGNSRGLNILFDLGSGTTSNASAPNVWSSGNFKRVSGATSVVGTNGATFYLTGVQLEKGSTATSFDYRPYGTELQLCQRYFYRNTIFYSGVVGGGSGTVPFGGYSLPVTMRAGPTATWNSGGSIDNGSTGYAITSLNTFFAASPSGGYLAFNIGSNATIGRGCAIYNADTSFSAEL